MVSDSDLDMFASSSCKLEVLMYFVRSKWASVLVVAPLSANSLAKFAWGLSDNLLSCVFRAWRHHEKPAVVAPAMNTYMWNSPLTSQHLKVLKELGVHVLDPVEKTLACGDVGVGGLAEPKTIATFVSGVLSRGHGSTHEDASGENVSRENPK